MMNGRTALAIGDVTAIRARRRSHRSTVTRLDLRLVVLTTTTFALVAYLVCIALGLVFPSSVMWVASLAGFTWTIGGVLLGLFQVGWYAVLGSAAYVWLYNAFAARLSSGPR